MRPLLQVSGDGVELDVTVVQGPDRNTAQLSPYAAAANERQLPGRLWTASRYDNATRALYFISPYDMVSPAALNYRKGKGKPPKTCKALRHAQIGG